jgi:hypothetical protein
MGEAKSSIQLMISHAHGSKELTAQQTNFSLRKQDQTHFLKSTLSIIAFQS